MAFFDDSARTALVTSAALLIAGFSTVRNSQIGLSLVDAQVLTMLVAIATAWCLGSFTPLREEDRNKLGFFTQTAILLHGALSCAFGIYVYSDPSTFGGAQNDPGCPNSAQTFVMFGASISATNRGLQIFALLAYSLSAFGYVWTNRGAFSRSMIRAAFCITGEDSRIPKEFGSKRPAPGDKGVSRKIDQAISSPTCCCQEK